MTQPQDILDFWFPPGLDADEETHRRQFEFWFGGGANSPIAQRFANTLEAAARGELDGWAHAPHSRLALIIVLDQFSRSLYRDSAQAYALDDKAVGLAVDGLACGFYDRLSTVWEKTFFMLPLGHSEQLALLDRCGVSTGRTGAGTIATALRLFRLAGARPPRGPGAFRSSAAS